MQPCSQCGNALAPEDSLFCANCGARLTGRKVASKVWPEATPPSVIWRLLRRFRWTGRPNKLGMICLVILGVATVISVNPTRRDHDFWWPFITACGFLAILFGLNGLIFGRMRWMGIASRGAALGLVLLGLGGALTAIALDRGLHSQGGTSAPVANATQQSTKMIAAAAIHVSVKVTPVSVAVTPVPATMTPVPATATPVPRAALPVRPGDVQLLAAMGKPGDYDKGYQQMEQAFDQFKAGTEPGLETNALVSFATSLSSTSLDQTNAIQKALPQSGPILRPLGCAASMATFDRGLFGGALMGASLFGTDGFVAGSDENLGRLSLMQGDMAASKQLGDVVAQQLAVVYQGGSPTLDMATVVSIVGQAQKDLMDKSCK